MLCELEIVKCHFYSYRYPESKEGRFFRIEFFVSATFFA